MIRDKTLFYWWLVFCLMLTGFAFSYLFGFFYVLWDSDVTYLSWLIILLFIIMTGVCGYVAFCYRGSSPSRNKILESGWFCSELCLTLGMIGTIVGFTLMLAGFSNFKPNDSSSIVDLITVLGRGMSTALYTTLVGLICGTLLKIQLFILEQKDEKQV
jgi:hypothetical protein